MSNANILEIDGNRVLFFGCGQHFTTFRKAALSSNINLSEFSRIFLYPTGFHTELPTEVANCNQIPNQLFTRIVTNLQKFQDRLNEWVLRGGHLFIVIDRPLEVRPTAGTDYQFNQGALCEFIKFSHSEGRLVEACNDALNESCLRSWLNDIRYFAILQSDELHPILNVSRSRHGHAEIISGWMQRGQGKIILLPPIEGPVATWAAYLNCWASLSMTENKTTLDAPEWTAEYVLPQEAVQLANLQNVRTQIANFRQSETQLLDGIEQDRALKTLFFASPPPRLENYERGEGD